MLKNYILFTSILSMFVFCENSENNKSNLIDKSEEAFARIDKKNIDAFTKEDRRRAFNNSVSTIEKTKKSLSNNVSYNGYGSSSISKKTTLANNSKVETKKQRKKKSAYSAPNALNSQVFSAYSTN